jgi:hypothetical protein
MTTPRDLGVLGLLPELLDELRAVRAEQKAIREQLDRIEAPHVQEVLYSDAVAARRGQTVGAFNAWLRRPGGRHVLAIAKKDGAGRRFWKRLDLELLEEGVVTEDKLRAVGG